MTGSIEAQQNLNNECIIWSYVCVCMCVRERVLVCLLVHVMCWLSRNIKGLLFFWEMLSEGLSMGFGDTRQKMAAG